MQEFKMFGFKCYYLDRITLLDGEICSYKADPLWRKMQQEKKAQRR